MFVFDPTPSARADAQYLALHLGRRSRCTTAEQVPPSVPGATSRLRGAYRPITSRSGTGRRGRDSRRKTVAPIDVIHGPGYTRHKTRRHQRLPSPEATRRATSRHGIQGRFADFHLALRILPSWHLEERRARRRHSDATFAPKTGTAETPLIPAIASLLQPGLADLG